MNLAKFPRRRYTPYKTPIEFLPNFTKALGAPNIYIKRDDLLGLTMGGNKTRKLEFLMADAIEKGADTIITCGAVQSNHCRLTLSAAVKEGLKCQLILEERIPNSYKPDASGNNYLFNLLGVEDVKVVPGGSNMDEELESLAEELKSQGRNPYVIPGGGSNPLGALGYVACAEEILEQMFETNTNFDYIVTATGSTGTQAGLIAGLKGNNAHIPLIGISVRREKEVQIENVFKLASQVSEKLELDNPVKKEDILVYDEFVGKGYAYPTQGMIDAVQLLARTEGILVDPVYSGKALDGLINLVKDGHFKDAKNILFIHTGGSPVLFAYQDETLNGIK
ncbi:MAG: D-cysteine desulfhydrase [Tissierellia bacterium]|nr:D-cysteine desulfhydrase [Tissierellia bacterium]